MTEIYYSNTQANTEQIFEHLKLCNNFFIPKLEDKVNIEEYAKKIKSLAINFEAWHKNVLVGLVAVYKSETENFIYITNVSVLPNFSGLNIGAQLIKNLIEFAVVKKVENLKLEVNKNNIKAINLYKKLNFEIENQNNESFFLKLNLYE